MTPNEKPMWWEQDKVILELKKRSTDLKAGKDKGVSWEHVKKEINSKKNNAKRPK